MSLLPEGETTPKSNGGLYVSKFENEQTRFRFLECPVMTYWEAWRTDLVEGEEKRVTVRAKTSKEVEELGYDKEDKFGEAHPVYYWAVKILLYDDPKSPSKGGLVKILKIRQRAVWSVIEQNALNEDWANPLDYDMTVVKTGEGKKTRYAVQNSPPKPFGTVEQIEEATTEASKIDLTKLLTNENPIEEETESTTGQPPVGHSDF